MLCSREVKSREVALLACQYGGRPNTFMPSDVSKASVTSRMEDILRTF